VTIRDHFVTITRETTKAQVRIYALTWAFMERMTRFELATLTLAM